MKTFLTFFFAMLLIGIKGFSQDQARKQEPTKKSVYEFSVSGMTSVKDAEKLDNAMTHMMGIYSSKTDFNTKKVNVFCAPGIDYRGLQLIVQSVGLVADDSYLLEEVDLTPAVTPVKIK